MSWRFIHDSALSFVLLSLLLATTQDALGQFKDLDQPVSSETSELDLTPSQQTFTAPVKADKPQAPAKIEQPKPAPVVKTEQPKANPTDPTPEPVPMPELQAKGEDQKKTVAAEPTAGNLETEQITDETADEADLAPIVDSNPMDSFSKHKQKSADPKAIIETASFNGIQPGISDKRELIQSWGETETKVENEDGSTTFVYAMPSFKQVDATVNEDDLVVGIIVHLEKPVTVKKVSKELGIGDLIAVPIPDEYGEILGQAFPERGLMMSFTENIKALRVSTILIEPVSAEMFRLRAQYDFGHHYERSLADLEQAILLDPSDADAFWLRSQYLDLMGKSREAIKSVQKAIRISPTNPLYRITRARLYAKTNRIRTGMQEVKEIIRELELPDEISGRAHNLLGDMYAMGRKADHQLALKHHLKAIDYSVKSVSDQRFAVRRAAKHVLVNAHVSVARDIAMGNFQRQSQVVPKWLLRATEMADEFISDDQGDELLQMQIFRDTLASYAELKSGEFDAGIAIEEALRTGRQMIADANDDYYKIQVERMLAESLYHAAKIHRAQGRYDSSLKFANNALGLLDGSKEQWEAVAHDHYLEAQLSFLVGSIYALRDNNHFDAVEWYAKARRQMSKNSGHTSPLYSDRNHGEMYVSMGLSYWEADEQDEAMRITLQGATIMKDAVEDGTLQLEAMSVPYGNLATMHGQIGNGSKSQEFAKLVAKIEEIGSKTR